MKVFIMKKTEILFDGGIYIFRGLPSANSMEFENESEAKLHLELFDRYLKNYVKVLEFRITKEGWEYLVQIKDKRTLKKHILKDSNAQDKSSWDVTRIIGERIRIFRLLLRRELNRIQGRKGTGVRNVYEKYYFESIEEAEMYIKKMKEGEIDLSQPENKYKSNENHYDIDGRINQSEEYGISMLSSETFWFLGKKWMLRIHKIWMKALCFLVNRRYIVYKLIQNTIDYHSHKFT